MAESLVFIVIAGLCIVVPSIFEQNSDNNEEHIINCPWLKSEDKFHFISRWGA